MRRTWSRDELILTFNLYCRIPFGRIHIRNPEVIALAKLLGRSPSAVSWKLANFASFDPALKARQIAGASHGSKQDFEVWNEFNADWNKLAFESESLRSKLSGAPVDENVSFPEGKTREARVQTRVNQGFFRATVLAAYDSACCVTGLSISDLLVASHIVPWSIEIKNRTNPRNGLCLNALHDKAFDCGLMTITTDYRVMMSPKIEEMRPLEVGQWLLKYNRAPISLPARFLPDPAFLQFHNENVFDK